MITKHLKSGAWLAIVLAGCVTSSNLALADSQTSPTKQTSSGAVIAPETTQSIAAITWCGNGSSDGCPSGVTQLPVQLDKVEIDRLLKFGGPH